MKKLIGILAFMAFAFVFTILASSTEASAATYYVDSVAGVDTNNGTATGTPWKTLTKVNGTTFAAGDTILFNSGSAWTGLLYPKGSGTSGAHIKIDKYGAGNKPIINGAGLNPQAVYLQDQPYWEIRNLDITNTSATRGSYVGIMVKNTTGGALNYVYIGGNTVHNVSGYQSGFYGTCGGIVVVSDTNNSKWNDVTIENNSVYTVDRMGIYVGISWQTAGMVWNDLARSNNIMVQNNVLDDVGGDGILNLATSNFTAQYNVISKSGFRVHAGDAASTGSNNVAAAAIWSVTSENTTFQYNEVYYYSAIYDGQAFDIDFASTATTVQYNYSHNNRGGFVLFCEIADPTMNINNAKVRFNISKNDQGLNGGGVISSCADYPKGPDAPDINNNTFYQSAGQTTAFLRRYPGGGTTMYGTAYIYNNIFYHLGSTSYNDTPGTVWDFNVMYGNHPASEPVGGHKLTSDPMFVQPGSGYYGRTTLNGYKLATGSPALGSGTNTGSGNLGPLDYYGNPVSATGAPSRGAYNGAGVAGLTQNFAFNSTVTSSSSVEAMGWFRVKAVDGSQNEMPDESAGFSSQLGITTNHTEWFVMNFGSQKTFKKVIIYPRNAPGSVGEGYPTDFKIQVWDGANWQDRVTVTGAGSPSTPQTYSWAAADWTDRVRIIATGLKKSGPTDYMMQFAEVEVTN